MKANSVPKVPKEFKACERYYYAAMSVEPYNAVVSLVMQHVFADCGLEIVESFASADAHQYIEQFADNLPDFPCDGPEETRLFANDLFQALSSEFQAGRFSENTPNQYWLCATLYSVLAGDDAIEREKLCKILALRIKRLLEKGRKAKTHTVNQGKEQANNKEPAKLRKVGNRTKPNNSEPTEEEDDQGDLLDLLKSSISSSNKFPSNTKPSTSKFNSPSDPAPPPVFQNKLPTKPDFTKPFNPQDTAEYLRFIGCNLNDPTPKVNENCKKHIQKNIENAFNSLKLGDKQQATSFVNKALKIWRTGRPE